MSRIFYAWELGSNLGHVGPFVPVADTLRERGHEVFVAARDTRACSALLHGDALWFQAPVFTGSPAAAGAPISYSDILLGFGYADPVALRGLLVGWRELLRLVRPELVVADHAPTAILAARTLGIPVMLFTSGFYTPPRCDPFPAMRFWEPVSARALMARDASVLSCINEVLGQLDGVPLEKLSDLFAVAEDALLALPETDHYPGRVGARYWGMITTGTAQTMLDWPEGNGRRIYCYLRRDHPHYRTVLDALVRSACSVIAFLPDLPDGERIEAPNVTVSRRPLDLERVVAEADMGVLYGGAATTQAFLMGGKPMLCLPTQLEQFLLSQRIEQLGAAIVVRPDQSSIDLAGAIAGLLDDGRFVRNANAFARRYEHLTRDVIVRNIVRKMEKLCSER